MTEPQSSHTEQTSMTLSVLVFAAPERHQGADTAYRYISEALQQGHKIYRVFFYHDGTHNGNLNSVIPQDENHLPEKWLKLCQEQQLDMVLCISSAIKRGVLDKNEALRHDKQATTSDGFQLGGLGQLVDAALNSDRLISFGA